MTDDTASLRTRWSMLDQLQSADRESAWAWFMGAYQEFVRDFVLRRLPGNRGHEFCEGVWAEIFRSNLVLRADRAQRFRGYLVGALRNMIRDYERRNRVVIQGADEDDVEVERVDESSMEHEAEAQDLRSWARATLKHALERLGTSHPQDRQLLEEFYGLTAVGGAPEVKVKDLATRLGIKPNAVHQAMFRARNRLREHFVEAVRQTVDTRADLEDEVRLLIACLDNSVPGLLDA